MGKKKKTEAKDEQKEGKQQEKREQMTIIRRV